MALYYQESGSAGDLSRVALLLHGRGSDEVDLLPLSPVFGAGTRVLSVRAPFPFGPGYAWYGLNNDGSANIQQLQQSVIQVSDFIDGLVQKGMGQEIPIFLMGFSQGGLMAAATALHRQGRDLAAVICLSAPPLPTQASEARLVGFPVFWGHGHQDPVVPIARGERAREQLEAQGAQVSAHRYPISHTISDEEMSDIRRWLGELSKKN